MALMHHNFESWLIFMVSLTLYYFNLIGMNIPTEWIRPIDLIRSGNGQ